MRIFINQTIGGIHDSLSGAIVLLQFKNLCRAVIIFKLKDIIDICTPEGINTLRIVANHANTLMLFRQLFHNQVLRIVGILVLVHQNILKIPAVLVQNLWMITKKDIGLQQQIVEIHGVGLSASIGIHLINLVDSWNPRIYIRF